MESGILRFKFVAIFLFKALLLSSKSLNFSLCQFRYGNIVAVLLVLVVVGSFFLRYLIVFYFSTIYCAAF
jgi:hypothetical protein